MMRVLVSKSGDGTPPSPPLAAARDDVHVGSAPTRHLADVRALSRLSPWRGLAQIALEWAGIVAAIVACHRWFSWPLYLGTVVWVGARQHALAVLMHEAVHRRLSPDRRVNEAVGEIALAWPLFLGLKAYREIHFAHHRHVNTPEDPDWVSAMGLFEYRFPRRWWELGLLFLATMTGFGAYRQIHTLLFYSRSDLVDAAPPRPARLPIGRIAFYLVVFGALALFHGLPLFLGYWLVPLLTWTRWIVYLRVAAEHLALPRGDLATITRTVVPSLVGRLLVAPDNIHYHLEHHLHPSEPFYNLPELHRVLMDDPEHRARAHVVSGYLAVLRECVAHRPEPTSIPQSRNATEPS
jgi:fatty acid desaturase